MCSLSRVLSAVAVLFIAFNAFNFYKIFYPPQCNNTVNCIPPKYPLSSSMQVHYSRCGFEH